MPWKVSRREGKVRAMAAMPAPVATRARGVPGRRPRLGVARPPCPRGHVGRVLLDGHTRSRHTPFDRPRYRCVPADGNRPHKFRPPLRTRHPASPAHSECDACERELARNDGNRIGDGYEFAVREIAHCFMRLGQGATYRGVSEELRRGIGRSIGRGARKGLNITSDQPSLAMGYLDAFGSIVIDATTEKRWPAIVSLDALPFRVRLRTTQRAAATKPWPASSKSRRHARKRRKILRAARVRERGRVLMATGKDGPFDQPRPVLVRFMGGGDEESWLEFLRSLPGEPIWVVSDRDGAIENAVGRAWPSGRVTHYLSEVHLAKNVGEAAQKDHVPAGDPLWELLEDVFGDPATFYPQAEARAAQLKAMGVGKWLADNRDLVCQRQPAKRAAFPYHPRSSGATESSIAKFKTILKDRAHLFRNADRLDRLLALVRNDLARVADEPTYSRLVRAWFAARDGAKGAAEWAQLRDPVGTNSVQELIEDAESRQRRTRRSRHGIGNARRYRSRRAVYAAQRAAAGLPPAPQGRPRATRAAVGSVAGKTVADFPWLVAEFRPALNGGLRPDQVPAGTGNKVVWKCDRAPDHEWPAQVRSRTIRGAGCPFCANRRVAPSGSFATTHPDIAAEWHPTRNGPRTPLDFTFGSHHEAWWQCPKAKTHVYPARISSRTSMLSGCPACAPLANKGGRAKRATSRVAAPARNIVSLERRGEAVASGSS